MTKLVSDLGYPGMVVTANPSDTCTYISNDPATIPYGVVVVQGTSDHQAILPTTTARTPVGVSVFRGDVEDRGGYVRNQAMNVLKKGVVYMIAEEAITVGAPILFRHGGTVTGAQGIGRAAVTASANHTALGSAVAHTSAAAGQMVAVYLNLP